MSIKTDIKKVTVFAFAAEGAKIVAAVFGHLFLPAELLAAMAPPQIRRVGFQAL